VDVAKSRWEHFVRACVCVVMRGGGCCVGRGDRACQMTEDTESAALTVVPLTQSALEVYGVANGSLVPLAKFEEVRVHGVRPWRMQ
jgi:hypothetical protein